MSSRSRRHRGPGKSRAVTPPPIPRGSSAGRDDSEPVKLLWKQSRHGAWAARGFHYQDDVGALLSTQLLLGELGAERLLPEGLEDYSCEGGAARHYQVKSRHHGEFSVADVARFIVEMAEKSSARREIGVVGTNVLVLERPVTGIETSQWTLEEGTSGEPLREATLRLCQDRGVEPDHVLGTEVVVLPWSKATRKAIDLISKRHGLLPQASELVLRAIRHEVTVCMSANTDHDYAAREALDRTRLERTVGDALLVIQDAPVAEALRRGLCEPADFHTPLEDPRFFEGVPAQPGHIAAGLPTPREELERAVASAAAQGSPVLIAGPSGVGKSVLLWRAAYEMTDILWFRVRRLLPEDVTPLVGLARAYRPTQHAPVGFLVDGVGIGALEAWDDLQRELMAVPHTALMGSIRSEDLPDLRGLADCAVITPTLDEGLAAQIHERLSETGSTDTAHWREAFENAKGLTLEYTHILSQGRRLQDVVTDQVRARASDAARETELQIIALVATAHQWGVDLDLRRVQQHLGAHDHAFRRALVRLQDEHVLHLEDGRVSGLHQLRSTALTTAVHESPPPFILDTCRTLLALVEDHQLTALVSGAVLDHPEMERELITAVLHEVTRRGSSTALAQVLHALRLVDFRRTAETWPDVFQRHNLPPALWSIATQFALAGTDLTGVLADRLRDGVAESVAEISGAIHEPSLWRDRFLELLGTETVAAGVTSASSVPDALGMLAVLQGTALPLGPEISTRLPGSPLSDVLTAADVKNLGEILSTARTLSVDLAHEMFNFAGGETALKAKLQEEYPTLMALQIEDPEGELVPVARLLYVSDRVTPDVEKTTNHVSLDLLRCVPMCPSVDVQTLLPGGHPIQTKAILRRYAPSKAEVAWNRTRVNLAALAAGSVPGSAQHVAKTRHAAQARALVIDLADYVNAFMRLWCLDRTSLPARKELADLLDRGSALMARADKLQTPLTATPDAVSLNSSSGGMTQDPAHQLVQFIADNLIPRMIKDEHWGALSYFVGDSIRKTVSDLRNEPWHLTSHGTPNELDQLDSTLQDLHAVLNELAFGNLTRKSIAAVASGPRGTELARVAKAARADATNAAATWIDQIRDKTEELGITVEVHTRPRDPSNNERFTVELALGIHIDTLDNWPALAQTVVPALHRDPSTQGSSAPILLVPIFRGRPIPLLAQKLYTNLYPGRDDYDAWVDQFEAPWPTPLADLVIEAHKSLQELSAAGILSRRRGRKTGDDETSARALLEYEDACSHIQAVAPKEEAHLLIEALGTVRAAVDAELQGNPSEEETLAAQIALGQNDPEVQAVQELHLLVAAGLVLDLGLVEPEVGT